MKRTFLFLLPFLAALALSAQPPTAAPDADGEASQLACATHVFSQPGVRFMHRLKAARPDDRLSVSGLPEGLSWNAARQRVEGTVEREGEYTYSVLVTRDGATTAEPVTLTVSSRLIQPVPFMGWLSWNVFEEEIDEEKMLAVAEAAKRYGLDRLGYRYLCLDDWWHSGADRPAGGKPDYDHAKFPHGLAWLADRLHGMGFRIGIYSDAAEHTCAGAFGSLGYEQADAKQYAEWKMDLLKYDYCGAPEDAATARARYKAMGDALAASGRDILFYACEWGPREPWKWAGEAGATCWRCTYDSRDFWDWGSKADGGHIGAMQGLDGVKHLWPYGGVNRFNDADMMMVGLHGTGKSSSHDARGYLAMTGQAAYTGMTQEEYQSQFSLWAMMASPLTLSFDMRTISDDDLRIISNEEMIAIGQDLMGQQAEPLHDEAAGGDVELYLKELENGDCAVAVLNRSAENRSVTLTPAMLRRSNEAKYAVHDVWGVDQRDRIIGSDGMNVEVASHQTRVFRIAQAAAKSKVGTVKAKPAPQLTVTHERTRLKIETFTRREKRISVTDALGHIVSIQTTTQPTVSVSLPGYGDYTVRSVSEGRVKTVSLTVWPER